MSAPTSDDVLRMAREAGAGVAVTMSSPPRIAAAEFRGESLERFAALVAAAERSKHQAEIQRLTTLANTAEKWRGIAMARDGDGRTVQEVQAEAVAAEREACAKVCEGMQYCNPQPHHYAAAIRERGQA